MSTPETNQHTHVAGLTASIKGLNCTISPFEESSQQPFYAPRQAEMRGELVAPDLLVDVSLVMDGDLPLPAGQPIFDGDESWRMFVRGEAYSLAFRWGGATSDHLIACCDHLTRHIEVSLKPNAGGPLGSRPNILDPFLYPLDQILLMNHLAFRRGFIVHSAGFVVDGVGFVLPGVSGAGKSTISRLFAAEGLRGVERFVLSDDRIIIREIDGRWTCWGTPWPGDAGYAENVGVPLKALLFLHKAGETCITPLAPGQAARRLFPTISCPWYDKDRLPHVLETCEHLLQAIPAFEFAFTPDHTAISAFTELLQTV